MHLFTKSIKLISHWLTSLILLDQYCVLCTAKSATQLCPECYLSLPRLETKPSCPRCLIYLPPKEIRCANCQANLFYFERLIAGYSYSFPLDKILQQLKYQAKLEYSCLLSQLFTEGISTQLQQLPDLIIPVPLHPNKHKLRGFNQVNELLRDFIQHNPGLPLIQAKRSKDTQPQANLKRQQRISNLSGAFQINASLQSKHIVIVDDVVTTAFTVNELAKVCKQQGAASVNVWCLMRAQP